MNKKTILITGSSTGIGKTTALTFQAKGWNVAATMRSPQNEKELTKLKNVICPALDVTDQKTITSAVEATLNSFGKIDVLVNNAGYGLIGPFEGATQEQVNKQFATNVFGVMNVTRSVLPQMRKQQSGKIINISSMAGRVTFPYYSLYNSSKYALEGFSESLAYELRPMGIQIKLIEPGAIVTDFLGRSLDLTLENLPPEYQPAAQITIDKMVQIGNQGSPSQKVANTIWKAANDHSGKMQYPVGIDAHALVFLRNLIPGPIFRKIMSAVVMKGSSYLNKNKETLSLPEQTDSSSVSK